MGQSLGMIVADTQVNADAAADAVVVTYGAPTTRKLILAHKHR
jgi:CO/xanthine dehydrogenase Mo-binding subunit